MLDLDAEIENWVRTVRAGRTRHQCGSLEGQYRPTLGEIELLDEVKVAIVPLRVKEGWLTERAWRTIDSAPHKRLLSLHYVRNIPLDVATRKARLANQRALWAKHLQMARAMLAKRLICYIR